MKEFKFDPGGVLIFDSPINSDDAIEQSLKSLENGNPSNAQRILNNYITNRRLKELCDMICYSANEFMNLEKK